MNRLLNWFAELIDPFAGQDVVRPPTGIAAFFMHFMWPVRHLIAGIVLVSLVTSIAEMSLFVFMGILVDRVSTTPPELFFSENALMLAGMAAVILLVRPIAITAWRGFTGIAFVPGVTAMVRWHSYRYVLRQSLSFFQNDFAGRIAQKVMQSGPALRESVVNVTEGVWTLIIYLIGITFLFAQLHLWLVVAILVWVAGYVATIYRLVPPIRKKSEALAEANSGLSGRIVDGYTNIEAVKLFAHAEREDRFARTGFERQVSAFRALMTTMMFIMLSLNVLNAVLIFAVAGLSLWLWSQGVVSAGEFAMATGLVMRLNQMSGWILRTITSLFENIGTLQNAIGTISRPNEVVDKADAVPARVDDGAISFEDVRFRYGGSERVLQNLSLDIKPGERVGLVGRSGAGKSTLVNLLLRFYDLEGGRILIDGQDIREVTQESLRAEIGMVTQDTSLLHRSVRDNIAYGRPEATEEEVIAAARKAEAHDFILGLRDFRGRTGYDAHVGERGVKLSGGQRQRIAIARLILKDAPILVLDEATSALDSEVEAIIQKQLYGLMEGRTVIAIAHRLSTIAVLDRLVVMDEGGIAETGTHAELLARDGLYAAMWRRQSGGFLGLEEFEVAAPSAAE